MRASFQLKTIVATLGLLGAAVTSQAYAQNIKFAMVIPTTGPLTQYGDMVKEGVSTAVEQINAAGGINGKKIEVTTVDDACEPKQGPVAANRVVNSKIGYMIGPVCSGAAIAAAPIYDNEGVVVVTPSATSPALTEGKNFHYIFRTIGRDDQQGPSAAKFIIEKAKPTKVAVLHDKQSYGQGIASSVRDQLQKAKVNVALFEGINAGDSDYSAIITKLKSAGVEYSLDGHVLHANQNFLDMFGYTLDEVQGEHYHLFCLDTPQCHAETALMWQQLQRGDFASLECQARVKHGELLWVQTTFSPILDAGGKTLRSTPSSRPQAAVNIALGGRPSRSHKAENIS